MVDTPRGASGSHADPGDPLIAFAAAVRDMWALGASTLETALAQTQPDGAAASLRPCVDQMLRAATAFRDLTEAGAGAVPGLGRSPNGGTPGDVASLAAQACLIASVGGLRYWRKLAQTYGAHQAAILQSLSGSVNAPGGSEEEKRVLTDELRAYLREIGDVSVQEARAFQSELEKLAAEVATAAGSSDASPDYRRRWKAKP
jgi:hypothetical protein